MIDQEKIIESLFNKGWYCKPQLFGNSFVKEMNSYIQSKKMKEASVGVRRLIDKEIRKDKICWLEKDDVTEAIKQYFVFLNNLSKILNEFCYMGINDFECHLALYEPGGFYKPHYDNFESKNNRAITVITYLNENWTNGCGGVLKLKIESEDVEILPIAGTTVIFMSDLILHEVTQSKIIRKSITGWLLKNKVF